MTLHVTLWLKEKKSGFSTGGEKIFQISSNTPLFLLFFFGGGFGLFDRGCSNYIWHTPCCPSLPLLHTVVW